jgi:NAD(P)H-dependent FMN reductase
MPTLGIIVGSTRPGRVGKQIADWMAGNARRRAEVKVDLIDLSVLALPFLDEPQDATTGVYTQQHTRDWSDRVRRLDAVVLVTPEYNNSFPAPLKNALDYLSDEWGNKPVAMVGYGGTSSGTRAVQALLPVVTSLGMLVTGAIYVPLRQRLKEGQISTTPLDEKGAAELLERLLRVAGALRSV